MAGMGQSGLRHEAEPRTAAPPTATQPPEESPRYRVRNMFTAHEHTDLLLSAVFVVLMPFKCKYQTINTSFCGQNPSSWRNKHQKSLSTQIIISRCVYKDVFLFCLTGST